MSQQTCELYGGRKSWWRELQSSYGGVPDPGPGDGGGDLSGAFRHAQALPLAEFDFYHLTVIALRIVTEHLGVKRADTVNALPTTEISCANVPNQIAIGSK